MSDHPAVLQLLSKALHQIRSTPPRIIASPATQPRRAAVALIIRVIPPSSPAQAEYPSQPSTSASSLTEFFNLDWVNAPGARPEILFLHRDKPYSSTDGGSMSGSGPRAREAHVAFPGGRAEEGDEGGMYTAMRQTWEEIGLDLAENAYTPIGQLDDREITTSLGKRLLMILSPFVFLQLTPQTTPVDPTPGTVLHWVPLAELLPTTPTFSTSNADISFEDPEDSRPRWSDVTVDVSSRLAPRHSTALRLLVRLLVGSMKFPAIVITKSYPTIPADFANLFENDEKRSDENLATIEKGKNGSLRPPRQTSILKRLSRPSHQELKLWGLTLGMTLDFLAHMTPLGSIGPVDGCGISMTGKGGFIPPDAQANVMSVPPMAPSLTSVFPRFSYPDVNFWIWVFGKRYREVVRGWEASSRGGGTNDRRINWTGSALNTFYGAVRKALVVVIIVRAIFVLLSFILGSWLLFF